MAECTGAVIAGGGKNVCGSLQSSLVKSHFFVNSPVTKESHMGNCHLLTVPRHSAFNTTCFPPGMTQRFTELVSNSYLRASVNFSEQ